MLHYVRNKGTNKELLVKVLRSAEEADAVFKEFHANPAGGHSGKEKTQDAISRRYYWPGMNIDIQNWVCLCMSLYSGHRKYWDVRLIHEKYCKFI